MSAKRSSPHGAFLQPERLGCARHALWERINTEYHTNQRAVAEKLDEKKALRRGLDIQQATDILWTINHPSTWQLLVVRRGWSADQYEQWAGDTACQQLLTRRANKRQNE